MTSTGHITRRLLRTFDSATELQRSNGGAWYREAYSVACELAGQTFTPEQGAAVIAVMSPNTAWNVNVAMARRVVDSYRAGIPVEDCKAGLGANVRKAYRVLDGDIQAVKGPKVMAFFANIIGDPDHVTVDIWATRAAVGRSRPAGIVEHRLIAQAYRNAAKKRGISPRDFQAVVWVTVRDLQLALF
jgi:hypothetical protein